MIVRGLGLDEEKLQYMKLFKTKLKEQNNCGSFFIVGKLALSTVRYGIYVQIIVIIITSIIQQRAYMSVIVAISSVCVIPMYKPYYYSVSSKSVQ